LDHRGEKNSGQFHRKTQKTQKKRREKLNQVTRLGEIQYGRVPSSFLKFTSPFLKEKANEPIETVCSVTRLCSAPDSSVAR
jgi:hypothetical protein